jgi:hypothetical protein
MEHDEKFATQSLNSSTSSLHSSSSEVLCSISQSPSPVYYTDSTSTTPLDLNYVSIDPFYYCPPGTTIPLRIHPQGSRDSPRIPPPPDPIIYNNLRTTDPLFLYLSRYPYLAEDFVDRINIRFDPLFFSFSIVTKKNRSFVLFFF